MTGLPQVKFMKLLPNHQSERTGFCEKNDQHVMFTAF